MSKKKKEELSLPKELEQELKEHLISGRPLYEQGGVFSRLLQQTKNMVLEGEVNDFMSQEYASGSPNKRNGYTWKNLKTTSGVIAIQTPRDRLGGFSPTLVPKRNQELHLGFEEQVLALYAQGNSLSDIKRLLVKLYGVELSESKISSITDAVLPEIQAWRQRRLKAFYPTIYLDAIHFKVRIDNRYDSRAFYTVYAVDVEGQRDLLGCICLITKELNIGVWYLKT